jgi:hypothetical protein
LASLSLLLCRICVAIECIQENQDLIWQIHWIHGKSKSYWAIQYDGAYRREKGICPFVEFADVEDMSDHSLHLQILRGSWSIQIFNGQLLDVLTNQDTGRVLATRRPGDHRCEKEISLAQ